MTHLRTQRMLTGVNRPDYPYTQIFATNARHMFMLWSAKACLYERRGKIPEINILVQRLIQSSMPEGSEFTTRALECYNLVCKKVKSISSGYENMDAEDIVNGMHDDLLFKTIEGTEQPRVQQAPATTSNHP
ncbi:hypothetical protein RF11_07610 [Thelohanellus kitauei]|uniref:Uncharacterized protein n=1 Tax=Thelohanellus kitauei TaxID=669202 RepID=A0A0C2N0X3_THEKT|nr:hypothetical protein RF11_07610 [Thelohanellus kitauei]